MMLEVNGVWAGYGDRMVVKNVSFSLRRGDVLAVLGPNGSGKSTIIKVISGVLRPLMGRVAFDDVDLLSLSPFDRAKIVATLPQNLRFSFPFSVEEIIAMGRYPYEGRGREVVEEVIEKLQLQELRHRKITSLSGGEFKRVALAKILAQTPKLLLLDEPLSHLDLKHQISVMEIVKDLAQKGIIIISVFHEINVALQIADFIMLLKDGSPLAFASPEEITKGDLLERAFQIKLSRCPRCGNITPSL